MKMSVDQIEKVKNKWKYISEWRSKSFASDYTIYSDSEMNVAFESREVKGSVIILELDSNNSDAEQDLPDE